jgi:hypothetical protein
MLIVISPLEYGVNRSQQAATTSTAAAGEVAYPVTSDVLGTG